MAVGEDEPAAMGVAGQCGDGVTSSPALPAIHHVYAADQGLQLQNETVDAIMYDDAALLLLVFKVRMEGAVCFSTIFPASVLLSATGCVQALHYMVLFE
jgi:hypothetical protein